MFCGYRVFLQRYPGRKTFIHEFSGSAWRNSHCSWHGQGLAHCGIAIHEDRKLLG